jgi:hypothetical protein
VITQCLFTDCTNSLTSGGGLAVGNLAIMVSVRGSHFENCVTHDRGGAISAYSARSLALESTTFSRCRALSSGQSFFADVRHNRSGYKFRSISIYDSGFESAPMATDTFSIAHGWQNLRAVNVTRNRHLGGASAGFAITASTSCTLLNINVMNNSCDLGRTVFVTAIVDHVRLVQSTVAFTSGGPLGVVTLDGALWIFENVSLVENERDSDWIVGFLKETTVVMVDCVISLSASDFELRTERVVITHNNTTFGGNLVIDQGALLVRNDTAFGNLSIFNVTHPLHGKFDKFVQMRSDDIYREPEIALLDETVVCLVFPLFIVFCFIWLRSIYAPSSDLGAFLREAAGPGMM